MIKVLLNFIYFIFKSLIVLVNISLFFLKKKNQLLSPAFLSDNRLSVENSLKKTLCTVKLFLVFEALLLKQALSDGSQEENE